MDVADRRRLARAVQQVGDADAVGGGEGAQLRSLQQVGGDATEARAGDARDVVADHPDVGRAVGPRDVQFEMRAEQPVRGIATSGWRGRSFSLGIADSVTVLARTAAQADAAATVIANAVDIDDPAHPAPPGERMQGRHRSRRHAGDGRRAAAARPRKCSAHWHAGAERARELQRHGLIWSAVLVCQGQWRVVQP